MERYQTTVKQRVALTGIGLHSGRAVNIEIVPAGAGTGVVFQRTDLSDAPPIAALATNISATELSTVIGFGVNTVSTVEHLMGAFAGLGIDNALVLIDAGEVPIMDGSAAPFVEALLAVGLTPVAAVRKAFVATKTFEFRQGDRFVRMEPAKAREFSCSIEFSSAVIGRQMIDFDLNQSNFLELCDARTFCHVKEVDAMRAAGLALGGSLKNAIVVTDTSVVNEEGLRSRDEFVRHKLLDCIGDLALLGRPLIGKISVSKAGHAMHAQFMKELLKRKDELLAAVNLGETPATRKAAMPEGLAAVAAPLYG